MEKIKWEFIVQVLLLPKIGKKTAFKIFHNLSYKLVNNDDLFDYLQDCSTSLGTPVVERKNFDAAGLEVQQLSERNETLNVKTISFFDEKYPKRFTGQADPPLILYCLGNVDLLNHSNSVGIIGTRKPYSKAVQLGQNLAKYFAEHDFNVVSGLAIGCDTAAHQGALDANGKTTAFLAHGLQMIYPKENAGLAKSILDTGGLLVSEYPTGTPPLGNYFVERDRLQAYLSDLLIVIQTDIKGGTMHAVKSIVERKKPLLTLYPTMPDFRDHEKSRGNEYIISNYGATPLVTIDDIKMVIEKYVPFKNKEKIPDLIVSGNDAAILADVKTPIHTSVEHKLEKVEALGGIAGIKSPLYYGGSSTNSPTIENRLTRLENGYLAVIEELKIINKQLLAVVSERKNPKSNKKNDKGQSKLL